MKGLLKTLKKREALALYHRTPWMPDEPSRTKSRGFYLFFQGALEAPSFFGSVIPKKLTPKRLVPNKLSQIT